MSVGFKSSVCRFDYLVTIVRIRDTKKSSCCCNCIIKILVPVYSQYCFPLARDGAISNYRIFLDIPNKILLSGPDKEEAVAVNLWNISTPAQSSRLPRRIIKYLYEVKTSHLNHKDRFREGRDKKVCRRGWEICSFGFGWKWRMNRKIG